jgi:hypothetical protein
MAFRDRDTDIYELKLKPYGCFMNTRRNISTTVILFLFSILHIGCPKDKPCTTCPKPEPTNCEYPTGNRNFTWRLDTVAWFPSTLGGVWAFSDTDAYVMGYIVDGKPPYDLRAGRHWNGKVWEDNINGTYGFYGDIKIDPRNDVTGDDHFMVCVGYWGDPTIKAGIAEFDNNTKKWKSYQLQTVGELRSVWTDGSGYFIAVGDNGMVYTKDGYSAGWVYQQAPTNFHLTKVTGISKNEIYARAGISLTTGEFYQQIWKYGNNIWIKLMDSQDTSGMPIKIPEAGDEVYEVAASRCLITDSLHLYITGRESFKFTAKGNELIFEKENLVFKGLPSSQQAAGHINLFSPNDYWASGLRYQLYHWNGSNFQKVEPMPTLPYGQLWGEISRIQKNSSGKIWMVLEMSSQVYAVLQGTP